MRHQDKMNTPKQGLKLGASVMYADALWGAKGRFIIDLRDSRTGELLHHEEKDNIITRDGGVLAAICFAAGSTGASGLTMLGVGTGATGPLLNPDAPDNRQRRLNAEIARRPFSSVTFRTSAGAAASVPTNVLDFTTIYGEGEAVGPLNEMGLMRTLSGNPAVTNPVLATFPAYDPTVDLNTFDILVNYLTFSVISKPSTSVLTITWRLTF